MLAEMAKGFESPTVLCGPSSVLEGSGRCSKRTRLETNPMVNRGYGVYAYRV